MSYFKTDERVIPRGIGEMYQVPMPTPKRPPWVTGYTPPKHRLRYRFWLTFGAVTQRLGTWLTNVAVAAHGSAYNAGPQAIIDVDKIPTEFRFAWESDDR